MDNKKVITLGVTALIILLIALFIYREPIKEQLVEVGARVFSSKTSVDGLTPALSPTCAFSATRPKILYNQVSRLAWNCANVDTCFINPELGQVRTSGEVEVSPKWTTTYTLTCKAGSRQVKAETTIQVFEMILQETGVE